MGRCGCTVLYKSLRGAILGTAVFVDFFTYFWDFLPFGSYISMALGTFWVC